MAYVEAKARVNHATKQITSFIPSSANFNQDKK